MKCLPHFAHTDDMLISLFFCWSINLKIINILDCLLQAQIHGKYIQA